MAKQKSNTDREERGKADETLLKATGTKADGTILYMSDFLEGPDTGPDGEEVGVATGELYDDAVAKAFPPGDSNAGGQP